MRRRRRRDRAGFTLVEVLIAIAVIAILTAMIFLGFRYVGATSRANATHVTLQTLKSMMAEYEASGASVDKLEDLYRQPPPPLKYFPLPLQIQAQLGSVGEAGPERNSPLVDRTRMVMSRLLGVPNNRKVFDALPPENVWRTTGTNGGVVLLDSFHNPIIFVPSAGMAGVNLNPKGDGTYQNTNYVVLSTGNMAPGGTNVGRPFFASAGEDGDFSKGDDNVYSFEK